MKTASRCVPRPIQANHRVTSASSINHPPTSGAPTPKGSSARLGAGTTIQMARASGPSAAAIALHAQRRLTRDADAADGSTSDVGRLGKGRGTMGGGQRDPPTLAQWRDGRQRCVAALRPLWTIRFRRVI